MREIFRISFFVLSSKKFLKWLGLILLAAAVCISSSSKLDVLEFLYYPPALVKRTASLIQVRLRVVLRKKPTLPLRISRRLAGFLMTAVIYIQPRPSQLR